MGTEEVMEARDADLERQVAAPMPSPTAAKKQDEDILAKALTEVEASQLKVEVTVFIYWHCCPTY